MTERFFNMPKREIDPIDIQAAFAMVDAGFSEKDIIGVLGYMPRLDVGLAELERLEHEAPLPGWN